MPSWKKVIVSGSQAELAAVSASAVYITPAQQITNSPSTTILSGSFSGSFSGNGSGLTGISATVYNPINPRTDIIDSTRFYISASNSSDYITYGDLLVDLAGANLATQSNDSLTLASTISNLTSVSATSFTGSLSGTASWATNAINTAITNQTAGTLYFPIFVASGSGQQPQLVNSSSFSYNAATNTLNVTSSLATVAATATTASYVLTAQTASYVLTAQTASYVLTAQTASFVLSASYALSASSVPLAGVSGITSSLSTFLGNPTSANLASAVTDETGTGNLVFSDAPTFTGIANFTSISASANVHIAGNLTVAGFITGSATIINATNVAVKDQFILLASGSTAPIDGGIIVQDAAGTGEALYWEGSAQGVNTPNDGRWAISSNVNPTTTVVATVNSYLVSVSGSTSAPGPWPAFGSASFGYGNMHVNTTSGDIWIWS